MDLILDQHYKCAALPVELRRQIPCLCGMGPKVGIPIVSHATGMSSSRGARLGRGEHCDHIPKPPGGLPHLLRLKAEGGHNGQG